MLFAFLGFYALAFIVVALRYPFVALLLTFCAAPITSTISVGGLHASFADVNAVLAFPAFVAAVYRSRRGWGLGPIGWPIFFYLALCVLSSLLAFQGRDAVVSFTQMVIYMVYIPLLFSVLCPPTQCVKLLYCVVPVGVLWALVGVATNFNFGDAAKNAFGASIGAVFVIAYDLWLSRGRGAPLKSAYRFLLVGSALILAGALVLTVSRGAWLGTLAGVLVVVTLRRAWPTFGLHLLCLLPVLVVAFSFLPPNIQAYAFGFEADRWNIKQRYYSVAIAWEYFAQDPLLGSGVGLREDYDATNLILSTLAESGLVGAFCFFSIFGMFGYIAWRSRRVLPPSDPRFSLLSVGAALMAVKFTHGMVDHYWSRGAITMAWAGAGLVLLYYHVFVVERSLALRHFARRKVQEFALARANSRATTPLPEPMNQAALNQEDAGAARRVGA